MNTRKLSSDNKKLKKKKSLIRLVHPVAWMETFNLCSFFININLCSYSLQKLAR